MSEKAVYLHRRVDDEDEDDAVVLVGGDEGEEREI